MKGLLREDLLIKIGSVICCEINLKYGSGSLAELLMARIPPLGA